MQFSRFTKYAVFVLAYNLMVIAWGAYVRASGSGAGCGSHWPSCNGEIIPRAPTVQTLVEYSHRLTSGLALLLVVGLILWAWRAFERHHPARRAAALSMVFILTEALVGAGLVLFEYVAENTSVARALWMSGHLINTFLLLGALTATAWFAQTSARIRWAQGALGRWLALGFIAMIFVGVSGAVTALGGTLFPVSSLAEGLRQDLSPTSHILIRLRFYHPFIAIAVSGLLIFVAKQTSAQRSSQRAKQYAAALIVVVLMQLGWGALNLLLHAPIWLQLVHLLFSDLIWIALLLLALETMAEAPQTTVAARAKTPVPA